MRKLLVGLLVIGLLVVSGCTTYPPPTNTPPIDNLETITPPIDSSDTTTPEIDLPDEPLPELPDEIPAENVFIPEQPAPNQDEVILSQEPPINVTWISPGKVNIGNFYPGARAEYYISIHNGGNTPATFSVTYRYPDHVGEQYVKPPLEVQNWIIIADMTPVIAPKQTMDILIVLEMPEDAVIFAPKWEFWISVKDTTQSGMVQTELASRWLVSMR